MHAVLMRALDALEADGIRLDAFIRDDDAGWSDDTLHALLDVTQGVGVPIDLAVIPSALERPLVVGLNARMDATPGLVGVHQHGCSHANHEPQGRRCEFGPSRSIDEQRHDITMGRAFLVAAFGDRLDPIFTPPWNRCTADTGAVLADLGFAALSRDRRAKPATVMREMAVDVDWSRAWREGGAEGTARAMAEAIEWCATQGVPFGLMLHHAAMSVDERAHLSAWLGAMQGRAALCWRSMRDLAASRATVTM